MGAERFSETVAASISGGVGVFVYACVSVDLCKLLCVCVTEKRMVSERACECVRKGESDSIKKTERGNGGKEKIFTHLLTH